MWSARPQNFLKLSHIIKPICLALMLLGFGLGLYKGLLTSPVDAIQGQTVRIMYVHVPASWMALFIYTNLTIAAICRVIWRHQLAFVMIRSALPIGIVMTLISLITGSIWGKPMWGAWWVWDARLTSMFVLLLIYISAFFLLQYQQNKDRAEGLVSYYLIFGFINIPIIKFSVQWWNTLHQPPSVSKFGAPSLAPEFLAPLLWMGLGYLAYVIYFTFLRMETELLSAKLSRWQMEQIKGR